MVKGSLRAPESGSLRAPRDHLEHQKSGSLRAPENESHLGFIGGEVLNVSLKVFGGMLFSQLRPESLLGKGYCLNSPFRVIGEEKL